MFRRRPKLTPEPETPFQAARREADEKSRSGQRHVVSGTWDLQGQPLYFVLPADASDELCKEAAFLAREGRSMSDAEHSLEHMAAPVLDRRSLPEVRLA